MHCGLISSFKDRAMLSKARTGVAITTKLGLNFLMSSMERLPSSITPSSIALSTDSFFISRPKILQLKASLHARAKDPPIKPTPITTILSNILIDHPSFKDGVYDLTF